MNLLLFFVITMKLPLSSLEAAAHNDNNKITGNKTKHFTG